MDQARAEQIVSELQLITRIIYSGQAIEFKPSSTLLERRIKPSDAPFIRKDAAGQALYYIVEGKAGVDIGQLERIIIPSAKTVGEMSMVSTVLNAFDNLGNIESRSADVYAEEPMRLIVFNYGPLVELLRESDADSRKWRHQILINLNRIIFRKLMEVNQNFVSVVTNYGITPELQLAKFPLALQESLTRFMKKMRTIPNMSVSPHEMRGILIREGVANPEIIFLESGRVKVSALVRKKTGEFEEEENSSAAEEWVALDLAEGPLLMGESSILNVGSISIAQVETAGKAIGYRMAVQKLLRHLQRYPDMFEDFFKLMLELNYFRTIRLMQKTASL